MIVSGLLADLSTYEDNDKKVEMSKDENLISS